MQCATLYWLGGRPSCLECVRAKICTELKSVSKPPKGYSIVMKIGCQVSGLPGLIYTRITKKPLASPKLPKLSTSTDAAAGLRASGKKESPTWSRPSSSRPLPSSFISSMARGGMASRNFVWAAHGGILCFQLGSRSLAAKETTPAVA
jgi:hypothetical protein